VSDVSATISGVDDLLARFKALKQAATGKRLKTVLKAAALPMQNAAKENAPYRSGTLSRGITLEDGPIDDYSAKVFISTSNIPYAAIQEFGGTIKPIKGKFLIWRDAGGKVHAAKMVTIPPKPYLRPAFDTQRQTVINEFVDILRDMIQKAAANG
jgi:HK97 gp10 family phage protein